MRMFCAQQSLGRSALRVVVNGDPGLLERQQHIGLAHAEDGDLCEGLVLDENVKERVDGVFLPQVCHFRQALALQRKQLWILHHSNLDGFRARNLLPLVVPLFARGIFLR